MNHYRFQGIPESLADATRATMQSPQYGHPAHVEVATGYGPCRSCLNTFVEGQEKRILFTYDPFRNLDPYPSPGPVFIHEQPRQSFSDEAEFPAELRRIPLVLEAFGENRTLISEERFRDGNLEPRAQKLLEDA